MAEIGGRPVDILAFAVILGFLFGGVSLFAARFPHSLGAALAHSETTAQELKEQPKAHDKPK